MGEADSLSACDNPLIAIARVARVDDLVTDGNVMYVVQPLLTRTPQSCANPQPSLLPQGQCFALLENRGYRATD